jgi:hypothetical protein
MLISFRLLSKNARIARAFFMAFTDASMLKVQSGFYWTLLNMYLAEMHDFYTPVLAVLYSKC